ncbi:ATP-binding protein [Candidatus Woesearchaeota archaeon]|nr:ATP-binding protein [Candidatus Woesearchaeota archaeon]
MKLGLIVGKTTTTTFTFEVENQVKKFDYVQVYHPDYRFVLCQVVEITRDIEKTLAKCIPLGYRDKHGIIKQVRTPFKIGTEVLTAEDDFIQAVIELKQDKNGAYLGRIDGKSIDVFLDLQKVLTKHLAVLAKSGAGKSYTVGVLLEEIITKRVPLLIIDPHGEYSTLKHPNTNKKEIRQLKKFGLEPRSFTDYVVEYGDVEMNSSFRPLKLSSQMEAAELLHMLPSKLTNVQQGLLYNAIKNIPVLTFESLITELENMDTNQKWNIINLIHHLYKTKLFSLDPTPYFELVIGGQCTIINMKGMMPETQEIIVYKLLHDLFLERKKDKIPPFFAIVEEAHNFIPERSFGEAKSSSVIRNIASEGRKFGLGLAIISQRPARVDKSVLSQITTQIILKVTNPLDIKAISNSVEGINAESENEIKNLSIGNALLTGVVDMPLYVQIRPRMTKHGGDAINMIKKDDKDIIEELDKFNEKDLLPLIQTSVTKNDVKLMYPGTAIIKTKLLPCILFDLENEGVSFSLLASLQNGEIVTDITQGKTKRLPDFRQLTKMEFGVLKKAFVLKEFSPSELIGQVSPQATGSIESLVKKGYFTVKNGKYVLSDNVILNDIKQHAFSGKIDFQNIEYDEIIESKTNEVQMSKLLSDFAIVRDSRKCYLTMYVVDNN